jgi:hypothetical protein
MATMSLDDEMMKYWSKLDVEKKQSVLSNIKNLLKNKESKKQMTKEEFLIQYNKEIEEAEARMDAGHFTSMEDVLKESESW